MKYGVIGTGYWGSNHVRVAAELLNAGMIESLTLCDIDNNRVAALADTYDVDFVEDYRDLPNIGIEAVSIATPSTTHRDIAVFLLKNDINVLVEKPIALNTEDAWEIVDVADEENMIVCVGHIFRYHPALIELKRRIHAGEIGKIKYMQSSRFSFRVPRDSVGALYSLAVHDVDISNYLLEGRPTSVYAKLDSVIKESVNETASLVLNYEHATSVINNSWQIPVFGKKRDLILIGSQRSAYIDYLNHDVLEIFENRVVESGNELHLVNEGSQIYNLESEEPLKREIKDFINSVECKRTPIASGKIGAETIEILERAELSHRNNRVEILD